MYHETMTNILKSDNLMRCLIISKSANNISHNYHTCLIQLLMYDWENAVRTKPKSSWQW
jgi:hypothetical protein